MNARRATFGGRPAPRRYRLCLCALALLLGGCGFHLQGAYHPPAGVDALYVAYSNPYRVGKPPVVEALRRRLRVSGRLGGAGSAARLVVVRVANDREIVSISPIDGNVAEYRLRTEVVFDYIVDGRVLLDDEQFAVTRFYSYNDTLHLAAQAQRHEMLRHMQEQLANRIMLRIRHVSAARGE